MHKVNKTLEKGYKYTTPTFHYTHSFKQMLEIQIIIMQRYKLRLGNILALLEDYVSLKEKIKFYIDINLIGVYNISRRSV